MKQTPLYDAHLALGAKMAPFAGWAMPIQYKTGILAEHAMVREKAGLFDVSHMGEIEVKGPEAQKFLDYLTPSPVSRLTPGRAQYSFLCEDSGGMVDDIIIYCLAEDHYLLCVNAGNAEVDWAFISERSEGFRLSLENKSDVTALLALQGPLAREFAKTALFKDLGTEDIKPFHIKKITWQGADLLVARTGYTGEDGFEIFCDPESAKGIWDRVMKEGPAWGVGPVGLGARDTLRLEAALPLYGHELNRETSPVESGLSRFIDWEKSAFIGRERCLRDRENGQGKTLVGLALIENGIPRGDYPVGTGDQVIGQVTSGAFSPTLKKGIALAFVSPPFAEIGLDIWVEIRKNRSRAAIVERPFHKRTR